MQIKKYSETLTELVQHVLASHPNLITSSDLVKLRSGSGNKYAVPEKLEKAQSNNFIERYREIISDPLNLLISRVPVAGYLDDQGHVFLHNGNRVSLTGQYSYYSEFSDILVINRGVHEPLEEFCFSIVLSEIKKRRINDMPAVMLELGAYWGHYSMWMMKELPSANCILIEPNLQNMRCGEYNFRVNKYHGEFINDFVGASNFTVDKFLKSRGIDTITLLHSDIQGSELDMINGIKDSLKNKKIYYLFISTHSDDIHCEVKHKLQEAGYRVEVESSFSSHTTSYDGLIFASSPNVPAVFKSFNPFGRHQIANATPPTLLNYLTRTFENN